MTTDMDLETSGPAPVVPPRRRKRAFRILGNVLMGVAVGLLGYYLITDVVAAPSKRSSFWPGDSSKCRNAGGTCCSTVKILARTADARSVTLKAAHRSAFPEKGTAVRKDGFAKSRV